MASITKAETFLYLYRLKGYKLSFGTITNITAILLKLTDDDGVVGWGEANAMQPFTDESANDVAKLLGNELLPKVLNAQDSDPSYIDRLLDEVRPGDDLLAKGAISIALLDMQGKRLHAPVAKLLRERSVNRCRYRIR